jgi:3-phenylpropionate/trans-cinnamate dioxygenase ferredoxin subunit
MPEWVTVAKTDDLPEGELLGASVDDVQLLVANVAGEYRAVGDVCTHAGCQLSEGWIEGEAVECSCHGSMFDLQTGEAIQPPAEEAVPVYEIRVEGGEVQIARPQT